MHLLFFHRPPDSPFIAPVVIFPFSSFPTFPPTFFVPRLPHLPRSSSSACPLYPLRPSHLPRPLLFLRIFRFLFIFIVTPSSWFFAFSIIYQTSYHNPLKKEPGELPSTLLKTLSSSRRESTTTTKKHMTKVLFTNKRLSSLVSLPLASRKFLVKLTASTYARIIYNIWPVGITRERTGNWMIVAKLESFYNGRPSREPKRTQVRPRIFWS